MIQKVINYYFIRKQHEKVMISLKLTNKNCNLSFLVLQEIIAGMYKMIKNHQE